MNVRWRNSLIAAAALLMAAGSAWPAASERGCERSGHRASGCNTQQPPQAPEIDAGSGTSAIALVSGVLLLMRERARSKRPPASPEQED